MHGISKCKNKNCGVYDITRIEGKSYATENQKQTFIINRSLN